MAAFSKYGKSRSILEELGQEVGRLEQRSRDAGREMDLKARSVEKARERVHQTEVKLIGMEGGSRQEEVWRLREQVREDEVKLGEMKKEQKLLVARGRQLQSEMEEDISSQLSEDKRERCEELIREIQDKRKEVKLRFTEQTRLAGEQSKLQEP